ncbi:MAG: hypothetical protein ACRDX9_09755 [Acidimicrobiia bacterium]
MRILYLLLILVVLAACGGNGGDGVDSPCDLTDAEQVQTLFGGTVAEGVEGDLGNCDFDLEGGLVPIVTVFEYGSADGWDGTRQGYVDNRNGVTDVDNLGDAAFFPNDVGAREMVVQAGDLIFSVTVLTGFDEPTEDVINAVTDLSAAIAEDLGS